MSEQQERYCDCPVGGPCEEFGFTGRRADICAGRVLTPEKCETYRANWRRMQPSTAGQAWSFAAEHARWAAAGFPKRTDAEVDTLLAEHCQGCDNYTAGGQCFLCGCHMRRKLRMATAGCPAGHFPPSAKSDAD